MPSILAVSDEPFELADYWGTLGTAAYRLIKANTPAEALEVLHGDEGIDLLVCDYNLGQHQIDGLELVRQANEIRQGIVAIVTTSRASVSLQLQLGQLGKDGAHIILYDKNRGSQNMGELVRELFELRQSGDRNL